MSRVRSMQAWGPSTGPTACALAGRHCSLWGWRKGVPGGGSFHHCVPLASTPCGGCVPRGWWGAVPGGGGRPATVVRGVWCQALSLPRPPVLWSGRPGFRDPCVLGAVSAGVGIQHLPHWLRSVRAWVPSTGPTACALASWHCSLWGWQRGVPGGGAFHYCEGRLRSGAVPPPTARPLGGLLGSATHVLWARVCGCGGPTLSPWLACPVRAACRGGGGGLVSGAVPPPAARLLERAVRVLRPVCSGCSRCGRGDPAPAPQRAPLRAGIARCGVGGRASPGGVPSTIVSGVWCQALSLPQPPFLWSGQPGFRDPCVPGAVGAGVGTQHQPHSVSPCEPALLAVGVAERRPRGGAFHHCEGCLRSGAVPPPTARPLGGLLGSATHVLWAWVCGCGGPILSPWLACPVGPACRGGGRGPFPGGVACHRWEAGLVLGAVPPPAANPLERAVRVPRPVCSGCGRCMCGDPAPAPQREPLRTGVARCGGGGKASPGGCLPPL